jgi:hypothetical protein
MRWIGFVILLAAVPRVGFGFGLSFPGTPEGPNIYYQGVGDKLYRLLCEPGAVEDLNCPKDPAFLLKVSLVVSSINGELRKSMNDTDALIKTESDKLREQNPDVIALRAKIKAAVGQLTALDKQGADLKAKYDAALRASALIEVKLAEISKRLAVEGLAQDELLRLTESRRYFQKQQDANLKITTDLAATTAKLAKDRKVSSDTVDVASLDLGKLLGTLKVDSKELTDYQQTLKVLGEEKALVTELETRLNDPLPFSTTAWITEATAPGAKALTTRFLAVTARLNSGH